MKIEAGAGTGKTTRIVQILLEKLLIEGVPTRSILALTFTVKAAAEMRERLRSWLGLLLEGKPIKELPGFRPDLTRGPEVLEKIDQMEIGTIHSFAGHLLRLYPVEAGVPPDFQEDEGDAFRAVFEERWERWKAERLDAELLQQLIPYADLEEIEWLAFKLCEFGPQLEATAVEAFEHRLAQLRTEAQDLSARVTGNNDATRGVALAAKVFADPAEVQDCYHDLTYSKIKKWSEADQQLGRRLVTAAKQVLGVEEELVLGAVAWLQPFVEDFRRAYLARGFLSFDGLIHFARALLCDKKNEEVCHRLQERFQVILVDEFQDTDPVQGQLIWKLAEDNLRKLTVVGDSNQSIYQFRGADVDFYKKFTENLPVDKEILDVNWRSRPVIIDFVNAIFPEFRPLRVSEPRRERPGEVEVWLFPELGAEKAREAEAEELARMIRSEVDEGKWKYRDYAVLLRALSDAHIYLEALRRHGVEYAIDGGKYFYEAPEVVDFVNLLRAIVDPADDVAVAGLLRSPLGGLTDRLLIDWSQGAALPEQAEELMSTVRELYELSGRVRIDEWVSEIFRRLPVLEVAAATYRGEQAAMNVLRLFELAMEDPSRTPAAFLRECSAHVREEEALGESPLADEQLDVVRILSIHKAKGLEFPVVILPDLHRGRPPARESEEAVRVDHGTGLVGMRLGDAITCARFLIEEKHSRKDEEERERILYVAMTRVRERLILSGAPARDSYMARILDRIGEVPEAVGDHIVTVAGRQIPFRVLEPRAPTPRRRTRVARTGFDPKELDAIWRARARVKVEPALVTPSSLSEASEKRLHLPDTDAPVRRDVAAAVGTVCHAVLAKIDFSNPSLEGIERLARRFAARGCHSEVARESLEILEPFVRSSAFVELSRSQILGKEIPVVYRDGERLISAQIDLLFDRGSGAEIVDYKTDRSPAPEKYASQGRAYSTVLKGASFSLLYLRSLEFVRA